MATDGDRSRYWPAIEKKHGEPMQYWFDQVGEVPGGKYADQIARLREGFGFSQAHANAVVMYVRGSVTSKRVDSVDGFLSGVDAAAQATVRGILVAVQKACPGSEVVIAWNQPMVKKGDDYLFGVAVTKKHILLAPWGDGVLAPFAERLEADGYTVQKKTVRVPLDWTVDKGLLRDLVAARMAQITTPT